MTIHGTIYLDENTSIDLIEENGRLDVYFVKGLRLSDEDYDTIPKWKMNLSSVEFLEFIKDNEDRIDWIY